MARRRPRAINPSPTRHTPLARPIGRREWAAIAGIILFAIGLRFAYPNRMAIEHFDEGVYASNIFFSEAEGGQYPYRHLYAPPLLPFLIEWGIIFLGPQSIAPFLPALILGTATVPLAWWAVRNWFGPLAGLTSAWLIATSDFHILYSRTALTDVPVAFFILLAVYLYWEAVRRESLKWSIFAGVATGLAWWTKYSGWLPLAIALAGSIPWVITDRRAAGVSLSSRAKSVAACFATMAVVAFLVWSPVLWYLQPYGGYAAVAENHRGYLSPVSDWGRNAAEQAVQLAAQSGNLTVASIAMIGFVIPLLAKRHFVETVILEVWCAATIGWSVFELGPAFPLAALAFGGVIVKLLSSLLASRGGSRVNAGAPLALWLLAAWLCGMTLTTPFYTPYSRLAMPWLMAAILGACVWLWNTADIEPAPLFRMRSVYLLAAVVLLAIPMGVFSKRGGQLFRSTDLTRAWTLPGWEDRGGLEGACKVVAEEIEKSRESDRRITVVYVYETISGPATFFHLASELSSPVLAVVPAAGALQLFDENLNARIYVVTSSPSEMHSVRRGKRPEVSQFGTWFELVATRLFTLPSTIIRLDADAKTLAEPDRRALKVLKVLRD